MDPRAAPPAGAERGLCLGGDAAVRIFGTTGCRKGLFSTVRASAAPFLVLTGLAVIGADCGTLNFFVGAVDGRLDPNDHKPTIKIDISRQM